MSGIEKIKYTNTSNDTLNEIYVFLHFNAFNRNAGYTPYFAEHEKKIFLSGKAYGSINIKQAIINETPADFNVTDTLMKLTLPNPLPPGDVIEFSLVFEAYIPPISHRTGANAAAMWFGNFLPTVAVYDKNGWHTDKYYPAGDPFFSEASTYKVSVTTPADCEVISTGPENVTESDGKMVTTIETKPVRDFAFVAATNYRLATVSSPTGTDINFYYYSNISDENIEEYLNSAKAALEFYSAYIGPYPYSSLDIVETELFLSGGMEYPQIIFMDTEQLQKKDAATKSLVHEIAHQWFYNIIGNDQINEPWIDEGLASFFQDLFLYPGDELEAVMLDAAKTLEQKLPAYAAYRLGSSLSAYRSWSEYYNNVYVRGKLLFYGLYQELGPSVFADFIKACYKNYSFKIIYTEDLIRTAEEISGKDLTTFFNTWIKGI